MAAPLEQVHDALRARGSKRDGNLWQCPAHPDRTPSLSVDANGEGDRVLVNCHAGCETAAVLDALGLSMRDLYADSAQLPAVGQDTEYVYTDADGVPLYRVRRTPDKAFFQARYGPEDPSADVEGYVSGKGCMTGVQRVLYRLPQVVAAVQEGRPVYLVEGEKDADALAARGHAATTSPEGAGKWSRVADHAREVLAGAQVVVVQDKDDPGRAHAQDVAGSLAGLAASVQVVEAREGKDVSDHLGAGLDLDALVEVVPASLEPSRQAWELVNPLELAADPGPAPDRLRGQGGTALVYPASRVLLSGEPEAGKSWAALVLVVEALNAGEQAAWFDTDAMGPAAVVERLRMMGVQDSVIADRFRYSRADEALEQADLQEIADGLIRGGFRVVVVDSWDPALEQAGYDPNSNADVNAFVRGFVNPLFRAGLLVALVDHVTKDKEKRGRYSAGAGAKLRAVDVHLGFSASADRRLDRQRDGSVSVKVHKDRGGHLDRRATYRLELVHEDAGRISWDVLVKDASPGVDDGWRPTVLMERISRFLEVMGEPQAGTAITDGENVRGGKAKLKRALGYLVADGYVEALPGARAGWSVYRSSRAYRDGDTDA
jgi:hypothetical protein